MSSGLEASSEVLFQGLSVQSHGKGARGLFHLRAKDLKHNLGQVVIFSLPEVRSL